MPLKALELKVLLIGPDEQKNNELFTIIKSLGAAKVHTLKHIDEAEAYLKKETSHLTIIDADFEEFSGKEVISSIKRHHKDHYKGKDTYCLIYTASSDLAHIRSMISDGFSAVIPYPFKLEIIQRSINNSLRNETKRDIGKLILAADFFQNFSKEELKLLIKVSNTRRFQAGEEIISKGEPADCFYILLRGKVIVLISKGEKNLINIPIKPGQPFGEMAVLNQQERSAWCVAADDCIVLEIGSHIIDDSDYHLRMRIFAQLAVILAKRVREMNQRMDQRLREFKKNIKGLAMGAKKEGESVAAKPKEKAEKIIEKPKEKVLKVEKAEEKQNSEKERREEISVPKKDPVNVEIEGAEKEEVKEGEEQEGEEKEEEELSPFAVPTGQADSYNEEIPSQEEYDVFLRKINLRSDFLFGKVPNNIAEMIWNRMYGYWTGGKLAKVNPHVLWSTKSFNPGSPRLKRAIHIVAVCSEGDRTYEEAYLNLPQSHRCIGLTNMGCAGTFLGNNHAIDRFLNEENQKTGIKLDYEIPMDRLFKRKEVIEFLTHTGLDVREETLFLVFDDKSGKNTRKIREKYPQAQIVTSVKDTKFNPDELSTLFTKPEEDMLVDKIIIPKSDYKDEGFYAGQTVFLPDFSCFFKQMEDLQYSASIFGVIGTFAMIGPDYSGVVWGSSGGAEGAMRAAKAMYGLQGATGSADIAAAVNWADG